MCGGGWTVAADISLLAALSLLISIRSCHLCTDERWWTTHWASVQLMETIILLFEAVYTVLKETQRKREQKSTNLEIERNFSIRDWTQTEDVQYYTFCCRITLRWPVRSLSASLLELRNNWKQPNPRNLQWWKFSFTIHLDSFLTRKGEKLKRSEPFKMAIWKNPQRHFDELYYAGGLDTISSVVLKSYILSSRIQKLSRICRSVELKNQSFTLCENFRKQLFNEMLFFCLYE